MDAQTQLIFDRANAALYKATSSADGVLTLTQTTPETSDLASALMKGEEAAVQLAQARELLAFYADPATYVRTPIVDDQGERARALLDAFAG